MKLLRISAIAALCLFATAAQAENKAPAAPKVAAPKAPKAPKVAQPAQAAPVLNHTSQRAKAWAAERNLPVREIEVGPADRRVKRLFVPIRDQDRDSFYEAFGNSPKSLLLKLKSGDNHLIVVNGGQSHLWARKQDGYWDAKTFQNENETGPAIVVELNDAETDHVKQWFGARNTPGDGLYNCGNACMDFIGNIEVGPGADGANTLRVIPNAEIQGAAPAGGNGKGGSSTAIPAGRKLFDMLGVARSKDGRNMTYNMIHAASDRVQVIGIPVGAAGQVQMQKQVVVENGRKVVKEVAVGGNEPIERFNAMTDEQLLGPLPPQGVAGVVRPVK